MKKLLLLAMVLGLLVVSSLTITKVALGLEFLEWHTWTEKYVRGTTQLVTSENCVCAECNRKCGTGHETWCSSYQKPKAKDDLYAQTVDPKDLKKDDPKTPSLKTTPPPPLEKQEKEKPLKDEIKDKIKEKFEQKPDQQALPPRAEAESTIQLAQIPNPPPPTRVDPSTGTTVSPSTGTVTSPPPKKERVCVQYKTITIRYACGTEQKCQNVKIMDSYTTWHYERQCVDVEKFCTKSEEVCAKWEWQ